MVPRPRTRARLPIALATCALLFLAAPALAQPVVDAAVAETLSLAEARLGASNVPALERAIRYAVEAHHGQFRDGGRPAILHSLRVTNEVLRSSDASVRVAQAAVLHDVVEDTSRNLRQIRARFGPEVARLVDYVTLGEIGPEGKAARDRAYYERFRSAPRGAHRIKYHDRLDNVRDMSGWGVEGKLNYLRYTRATVIESLRARSPQLAAALDAEVQRLIAHHERLLTDKLAPYRRADGTLRWKPLLRDRALREGAGLAHFTLALFLKELAVVVRTGDRLRIEEFFEGLASTEFFVHYGLFAVGARAGEVAYSRYLARFVKPGFVSGVLRTNVVLAAGLALPQLARGTFDGKAFAISLGALGLSATAVRAGVSSLRWVTGLSGQRLSSLGLRLGRLSGVAGWIYTVAETAVVLYVADDLETRYRAWSDARAARGALADAGEAFFTAVLAARDDDAVDLPAALADYRTAWDDYRAFLARPLHVEEARLQERLTRLARDAKLASDRRRATLARLDAYPALKADVVRRHGSVAAFLEATAGADEADLARDTDAALAHYARSRRAHLERISRDVPRDAPYLDGADLTALLQPASAGLFARLGSGRERAAVRNALEDLPETLPGTLRDEASALAAAQALLGEPSPALDDARAQLAELEAPLQGLIGGLGD